MQRKLFTRNSAAMQAEYCHTATHLTLTGSCPPLSHYSDPHSVLSAGSQSRLCHQYWKAGGCCGTERGKITFFVFIFSLSACFRHLSRFDPVTQRDSEMWWSHGVGSCSVTGCIMLHALIHAVIPLTALNSSPWMFTLIHHCHLNTILCFMCRF